MTSLENILAGSSSGAVIEPGSPDDSLIYTLAAHTDLPKMPPNAPKIPQRELKTIAAWIESLDKNKLDKNKLDKSKQSASPKDATGSMRSTESPDAGRSGTAQRAAALP